MLSRLFPKTNTNTATPLFSAISFVRRLRPLSGAVIVPPSFRSLSTRPTIPWHEARTVDCSLLKFRNGCDYKPFEVVLQIPRIDPSRDEPTRDEIIDSYIKTLAEIVGSEDEARMMVYDLCIIPGHYFFGTLLSQELYDRVEQALPRLVMIFPHGPFVNIINGKLTKEMRVTP